MQRNNVSTCVRISGYLFIGLAIVAICFLYSLGTFEKFAGFFYVTGYGALSVSYYLATLSFAYMNRRFVEKRSKEYWRSTDEENPPPPVAVHVVGYREDPQYFRDCLESVKGLEYPNLRHITVVVDGNEEGDLYMADIARDVFGLNVTSINLEFIPSDRVGDKTIIYPGQFDCPVPVFVVAQPHAGKREALYTAYLISTESKNVEFFLSTDSDTILHKHAVDELVAMVVEDSVYAVAGRLKIFNKTNWLTYLTAARYFVAFNVERASQGFNGVVGCISGPLGLYRVSAVSLVVDEWVKQTFLGKKCTFGDDRHMTNRLLSLGGKIFYSHKSCADTETPSSYSRFVAQQTRWSKSYWRELLLQSGWATKHWYLMMETVYGIVFPVLVLVTLLMTIFRRSWSSLLAITVVTFMIPFLRCLVVFLFFESNCIIMLGVVYPILYFTTLIPVKFAALLTMGQNNWGTSSRKKIVKNFGPVVPVAMWLGILLFGIILQAVV